MVKKIIKKIIPGFIIDIYHFLWSFFSAVIYGFPGDKIKVIGITGTNGKSTTVKLISDILKRDGKRVATISSINFEIDGKERENLMKMTMPGRGFIQKFLKEAVEKECDFLVMEVTSEGIEQSRHRFIDFDVAVITNLAPEHIESHGGFENYKKAKGKFFKETDKAHVLNVDDEHVDYFKKFSAERKYGYGFEGDFDDLIEVKASGLKTEAEGLSFEVDGERFNLSLLGEFNAYNGLAAICVAREMNVDSENIKKAFRDVSGIPGRMEKVIEEDFTVFVDYAFTPNALNKVYKSITEKMSPNNLITVLGSCGGGRDKWKRPVLGEIAAEFGDRIIVTNEDPYDEDPMEIINQVARGAGEKAEKILDRREAIKEALISAKRGDVVIITGKGSESWIQVKNGEKIPWDDREVVREEYQKIKEEKAGA